MTAHNQQPRNTPAPEREPTYSDDGDRDGGARVYERPDPPFFQRHPVIIIVVASLWLIGTIALLVFVA